MSRFVKYKLATIVAFGIVVFFVLGSDAVLLYISLLLTYYLVRNKLSSKVFRSVLYKFVVTIVLYFALLQAVVLAAWIFDHNYPLNYAVFTTFVLIVIALVWQKLFGKNLTTDVKETTKFIDASDIISIFVCLLILALTVVGPMVRTHKATGSFDMPAVMVSLMDTNLDDASHLSRINDRLDLNRGVIYKSDATNYVVLKDTISTYPPGWYIANASLIKSVDPSIKIGGQTLTAFVITGLFWLMIAVFAFSRVLLDMIIYFGRGKNKKNWYINCVWLIGAALFFSYYTLIEQFKEGFYTYMPLLISLLIAIPLLIQLSKDKLERTDASKFRSIIPLVLVVTNLTLTWFLILPAAALAGIIAIFRPNNLSKIKELLTNVWKACLCGAPILLVAILGVLAQVLVITAPSSQTFRVGVDTPGGIAIQSLTYFIFVFAGIVMLYILIEARFKKLLENVLLLLVALLAFSLFIYIFQFITIHGPQYYYYKTLDTAMIVALPLGIVGWGLFIEYMAGKLEYTTSVLIAVGLLVCLPLVIGIQSPNDPDLLSYIEGHRTFSVNEANFMYKSISARGIVPVKSRHVAAIFYVPGNAATNTVGTNILRSVQPSDSCDAAIFYSLLVENDLLSSIKNCKSRNIEIVTPSTYYPAMYNAVVQAGLTHKVKVISVTP